MSIFVNTVDPHTENVYRGFPASTTTVVEGVDLKLSTETLQVALSSSRVLSLPRETTLELLTVPLIVALGDVGIDLALSDNPGVGS